jgi:hypothetical protein
VRPGGRPASARRPRLRGPRPEQNEAAVYRWLLEHNLKLSAVAFAVDRLGDIYLTGSFRWAS